MSHPYNQKQRFSEQDIALAHISELLMSYWETHLSNYQVSEHTQWLFVAKALSVLHGGGTPEIHGWLPIIRDRKYALEEGVHWSHLRTKQRGEADV